MALALISRSRPISHGKGYLIAALSIALSMLTLGYLALAAYASSVEDKIEVRRADTAAYFAAESGLVAAEHNLSTRAAEAPPAGVWLTGGFSGRSRFRLEVSHDRHDRKNFTVRSVGLAEGEGGRLQTVEFEARYVFHQGKGWRAEWRSRV
jgi:hypothetical protein